VKVQKLWVVRDPTRHSEMGDILFSVTAAELPRVILGTSLGTWVGEHTTLYTTRFEAQVDASGRMMRMWGRIGRKAGREGFAAGVNASRAARAIIGGRS
jgi:hypothetical protein